MTHRIAIIGSGPSGCFLAQALRKDWPEAEIDIIERLPVPYGLLRYGVAADHQGTKAVSRQFDRLFEREDVRFWGDVTLGRDVTLEALRGLYDAVFLALGLSGDRRLGIPGDDLPGVHGSGWVTRWLNSHPDEAGRLPALGARVVVIGNGNVALDLARLLSKDEAELTGSDLDPDHAAALAGVREVTVVGRGAPEAARFDVAMIKEFGRLTGTRISVPLEDGPVPEDTAAAARLAALRALDGVGGGDRRLTFRFGLMPEAVLGTGHVEGVRFRDRRSGAMEDIPADTLLTAIGFEPGPAEALHRAACGLPQGDALAPELAPGLYAAGWFRRGPRGTIPEARAEARIVADAARPALAATTGTKPGREGLAALLREKGVAPVGFADWLRIRAAEEAAACAGRVRRKGASRTALLALCRELAEA
ncbi:FAD-dependent oxidoreductase [Roseomonas gilardii subsp. gilardii]|uniref:FAD-dependent oxidoreductase n=1 Tax=Roseomonas gilardii TaxID=257708 RepID=UPI001FFB0342|nr:FAD-dependent oxidoreductase [Roseomonas gilardii]UPG73196.1 FAD-dependent oxidoreductase [Roseomonas gilardii subsp. gilardii]